MKRLIEDSGLNIAHVPGTGYQYYFDGFSYVIEDNDGNLFASGFETEEDALKYIKGLQTEYANELEIESLDAEYVCYASDVEPNQDGSRLYWKRGGGVRWCTKSQASRFSDEESQKICRFKGSHKWMREEVD